MMATIITSVSARAYTFDDFINNKIKSFAGEK